MNLSLTKTQYNCTLALTPTPEGTALASKAIEAMRDLGCEEVRGGGRTTCDAVERSRHRMVSMNLISSVPMIQEYSSRERVM